MFEELEYDGKTIGVQADTALIEYRYFDSLVATLEKTDILSLPIDAIYAAEWFNPEIHGGKI